MQMTGKIEKKNSKNFKKFQKKKKERKISNKTVNSI